jgi:transcriptional regulator with XRE-family HTH domain
MYEIFDKLLKANDVTAYRVAKETGITTATLSQWKKGISTPKQDKLQKIADYFGVSLEYLMTGEEKETNEPYYINEQARETAQAIFENKELRLLFDAARDADPEDLQAVHAMLLALKRKERGQ